LSCSLICCMRVVVPVEHVGSHCCNMCYFVYCSGSAGCPALVSSRGVCCFFVLLRLFLCFIVSFAVSVRVLSGCLASWSCYASRVGNGLTTVHSTSHIHFIILPCSCRLFWIISNATDGQNFLSNFHSSFSFHIQPLHWSTLMHYIMISLNIHTINNGMFSFVGKVWNCNGDMHWCLSLPPGSPICKYQQFWLLYYAMASLRLL
jgi:hypothetical protein